MGAQRAGVRAVRWHGAHGGEPRWDDPASCFLAVTLAPSEGEEEEEEEEEEKGEEGALYLAFNAHHLEVTVHIPQPPLGYSW